MKPASSRKWFYREVGSTIGPLSTAAIEDLKQCGAIDSATLVYSDTDQENWIPVEDAIARNSKEYPDTNLHPPRWNTIVGGIITRFKNVCSQILKSRSFKNCVVFILGLGLTAGVIFSVVLFSSKETKLAQNSEESAPPPSHQSADLVREADQLVFSSGTEPDWPKVVNLLERATALGNPEAAMKLGHCFLSGRGVAKNSAKAVELFRDSAEAGYAEGQYNLAVCYAKGNGVERNEEEMLKWLIPAANQELPKAMEALGIRYLTGSAVLKNSLKGFHLISKAAESGLASSQYRLSLCYEFGDGVEQDNLQAYKWALMSRQSGLKVEDGEIDRLKSRLNQQEQNKVQNLVAERQGQAHSSQNQKVETRPDIKIIKATFGGGRKWADVTTRVQDLVDILEDGFRVSTKDLKKDPTPGWKKALRISYSVNGKTYKRKFKEGKRVSLRDLLPESNGYDKLTLPSHK